MQQVCDHVIGRVAGRKAADEVTGVQTLWGPPNGDPTISLLSITPFLLSLLALLTQLRYCEPSL